MKPQQKTRRMTSAAPVTRNGFDATRSPTRFQKPWVASATTSRWLRRTS